MKYKSLCIFIFFALVTVNIVLAESQSVNSPSALVVEEVFEFDSVLEGTEVMNDFIIQNKGTVPLEIQNVETD
jgi:hypothetical protein